MSSIWASISPEHTGAFVSSELELVEHEKADPEGHPTLKIVAHRGYSGKYPELSPLAFEKALELPIHGIECDVRMSRDGKVVVNHDATLDRTSDRIGKLSALDWAEIKLADIGTEKHPQQYPLLRMLFSTDVGELYLRPIQRRELTDAI